MAAAADENGRLLPHIRPSNPKARAFPRNNNKLWDLQCAGLSDSLVPFVACCVQAGIRRRGWKPEWISRSGPALGAAQQWRSPWQGTRNWSGPGVNVWITRQTGLRSSLQLCGSGTALESESAPAYPIDSKVICGPDPKAKRGSELVA
ncbi:hypothetical protein ON010_g4802 [Phytophthora cinnamomi]|nr:hypothetical protein ON010_g4802 [Phytophthora cinnamomi]